MAPHVGRMYWHPTGQNPRTKQYKNESGIVIIYTIAQAVMYAVHSNRKHLELLTKTFPMKESPQHHLNIAPQYFACIEEIFTDLVDVIIL